MHPDEGDWDLLGSVGRVQAWVAGPGMGTGQDAAARLAAILRTDLPVLVDADGLTILSQHKGLLPRSGADADHAARRRAGPAARHRPGQRGGAAARARPPGGRRAGRHRPAEGLDHGHRAVGPGGSADEPVLVNPTGTPWLATAGSGDVLSGLAGALLAQGLTARPGGPGGRLPARPGRPASRGRPRPAEGPVGRLGPGRPRSGPPTWSGRCRPRSGACERHGPAGSRRPRRDHRQRRGAVRAGPRQPGDGRGEGRRVRPRHGPGRPGGAGRRGGLAGRRRPGRGGRAPAGGHHRAGAVPDGLRRSRRGDPARRRRHGRLGRVRREDRGRGRPGRRPGPAAPQGRHRAEPGRRHPGGLAGAGGGRAGRPGPRLGPGGGPVVALRLRRHPRAPVGRRPARHLRRRGRGSPRRPASRPRSGTSPTPPPR